MRKGKKNYDGSLSDQRNGGLCLSVTVHVYYHICEADRCTYGTYNDRETNKKTVIFSAKLAPNVCSLRIKDV